ncbi:MAG TPA: asparagine synthase (glutamine-hydrolyzing), partial [Bryobacteraceae bacterium]
EDASVQVICNGEIYNYRELRTELAGAGHRFRSESDSEVLAHGYEQWGMPGLLGRLRGMFAFVLYDARRKVCFAVRDRLGIKPLYYAEQGGKVVLASEVKAIASDGGIDPHAVAGFLLLGSIPHPLTWRKGVRCLEPATYLEISQNGLRSEPYWTVAGKSHGEMRAVLSDAVERHLISDAPLGVFLSSGVDSTGLVALARRAGSRIRTLTVTFDEADHNEQTAEIARYFETDHSEIRITARDFVDEIPRILGAMDQAASDGVNTYFVSKAARASGLKTVLSGLGGDEVFRGYRHYAWLAKCRREWSVFAAMPGSLRRAGSALAASAGAALGKESWRRLRDVGDATPGSLYLALRGFFDSDSVEQLTGMRPNISEDGNFQTIEMKRYLHDQLLRDADVFGMACSLEIRVPYLDHEVVETALARADQAHVRPGVNKPLLVDAIGDDVVLDAARRPKSGFVLPLGRWMRKHSDELREQALQSDLDRCEIRRLWSAFESGRMNATRAWALVVLGSMRA